MKEKELGYFKRVCFLLSSCWSRETSANPEDWAPRDLAVGQCAVTILVLQDIFGGDILRYHVLPPGRSQPTPGEKLPTHYTLFIDGREYDPTCQQFSEGVTLINRAPWKRQQMLHDYPKTMERYALLMLQLAKLL